MVATDTSSFVVPGVGRGYMDTNTVVQCNQSNPGEWLFYGRQYESRSEMLQRLVGINAIPSGATTSGVATTTTTAATLPPTEDRRPEFKRKETSIWSIWDNLSSVFKPSNDTEFRGMTPEKKKELQDAREAGRSTFWKNVLWGAAKAVIATVVIGAALAATGITFGAAAPLLVVAGVAVAGYMTMDAMQKKNDAEERLTEAVIQGDTNAVNNVVTKDMAASGDEFGTGVVGLGLGLYAGVRNVIPAARNVGTAGANCVRSTPAPLRTSPTARPYMASNATNPGTHPNALHGPVQPGQPALGNSHARTWAEIKLDAHAGAYPSSHNAALAQLPLGGHTALTGESVAVRNFNERNGIVAGQQATTSGPPLRQGSDISCGYGTMT